MDFSGILVLGLIWLLFNLLSAGRKGERPAPRPRSGPPRSGPHEALGGRGERGPDATQREGSRLEQLLRELERNLEQVGGTQPAPTSRAPLPDPSSGRAARHPAASRTPGLSRPPTSSSRARLDAGVPEESLTGAEEVEDRESFDDEPVRVVSLEQDVRREQRRLVAQDDAAEDVVRRRIDAARRRDRALSRADHEAFDARIRQEPADHTAVRRYTPAQLRDAIVWREILGPPVSEREE